VDARGPKVPTEKLVLTANILSVISAIIFGSSGGIPTMANRYFTTGRMWSEGGRKKEERGSNCDDAKATPQKSVH
jgi:hypothetical protein